MLHTTYAQLVGQASVPGLVDTLQGLTGLRAIYGDTTPIYILNVMDSLGLTMAVTCLEGVAENTSSIQKIVAMEMVKAHTLPWDNVFPGQLQNLLYQADQLLLSSLPEELRYDYCGDLIPGGSPTPAVALASAIEDLEAVIAEIDLTPVVYTYYTWVAWQPLASYRDGTDLIVPGAVLWATKTTDNLVNPVPEAKSITWYLPQNIDAMLATDAFLAQSDKISSYATSKSYLVKCKKEITSIEPNPANKAAVELGLAAVEATQLVLGNPASLITVISHIILAYSYLEASTRLDFGPKLARFRDLGRGGFPQVVNPDWAADEQAVIDAGLNLRAARLRDAAYVKSFDLDLSGTLTVTEVLAMETAIRTEMLAARNAKGVELCTLLSAGLAELNVRDTLATLFRPYLM